MTDDRYGRARSPVRRRAGIAVLLLVVAAALGWFAWAAYSGRESATGTDVGFVVVDDGTVRVTFDVTKPEKATATCTVEAMDSGFSVVGTVRVRVGPADHGVVRRTATVRTTNRATTGRVTSCSLSH
ncbi:MAG: DUF4307 domain-containing protein [Actinomycetales bacterium]